MNVVALQPPPRPTLLVTARRCASRGRCQYASRGTLKTMLLFRVRGLIADQHAFRCIRAQLFQMLLVIPHGPPLCPSSIEPQLCVNQIVRALIQIKQEFRWGRSLSAGAVRVPGGRALARRIAIQAFGEIEDFTSATTTNVLHCSIGSRIFCAERINVFLLRRRRRFSRCRLTWGNGWRDLVVASKPRTGLGYRRALRRLCDCGLGKHAE
jgi:hypothetical protein